MAFKNNMKMFRDICNVQHDKQKELFFFLTANITIKRNISKGIIQFSYITANITINL